MQIRIITDHGVGGCGALRAHVDTVVEKTLHHLKRHLTRVEVHLDAEKGANAGGDEKRCVMEARPKHHKPVTVSDKADNDHQAVDSAARKLKSALEHAFGKLEDRHLRKQLDEEDAP